MRLASHGVATNCEGPFGKDLNECHCDGIEIMSWKLHGVAEEIPGNSKSICVSVGIQITYLPFEIRNISA